MSSDSAMAPSPSKRVDPRLFLAAGIGGLIILIGLVVLVLQGPVYGALILVPLFALLAGLYWMKLGDVAQPAVAAQPSTLVQSGLAKMPQAPIDHDAAASPAAVAQGGPPEESDLGGDTPTVRGDRPRLRAAKAFDVAALMQQTDTVNPVQCPNCGQLARLSVNGDRTRARCADCGVEWQMSAVQPPTLVRSHVRVNVQREESEQSDAAATAQPN